MAYIQPRKNKYGEIISYSIRVNNPHGKPYTTTYKIDKTLTERQNQKKMQKFFAEFERNCEQGIKPNRQTFEQYCEYVLQLKEAQGLAPATLAAYRSHTRHIYPVFGSVRLTAVSTQTLNQFYMQMVKEGLSPATVHVYHALISSVLDTAVKESILLRNPAATAILPKKEHKEANHYELDGLALIQKAANQEPIMWKCFLYLLIATGCRRSELLGIKWSALDDNVLTIDNQILYTKELGIYEKKPKSAKSIRKIMLPPVCMKLIGELRRYQRNSYVASVYLFCDLNGKPLFPSRVNQYLRNFEKRYKIPLHLNAHAFRHTAATNLIHAGVDIQSVSTRLGHAQTSTTLNIYSHAVDKAEQENMEVMQNILMGNTGT